MSSWRDDQEELLAAQNEIRRLHSVLDESWINPAKAALSGS